MQSLISKIRKPPYLYAIKIIGGCLLIFFCYRIYIWSVTQSTDNAYIEADISNISAEVNGIVSRILVEDNIYVEAGRIVAELEKDIYEAQVSKAKAAVEAAEIEIEIVTQNIKLSEIEQHKAVEAKQFAEENFAVSLRDFTRMEGLSRENFASKQNLDNTKIALEKSKTELVQADFNMQKAQEELKLLEIKKLAAGVKYNTAQIEHSLAVRDLEHTSLKSPIDGIVANSSLRKGNLVRTGVNLFSVVPIDKLYIKANFKETQISKFVPRLAVEIILDAEKSETIIGRIRSLSPATGSKFSLIPPANATGNFTKIVQRVPVLIDFDPPDSIKDKMIPGMSVYVKVRTDVTSISPTSE